MAGDAVAPVALGTCYPRAAIEDIPVSLAATEDDEPNVDTLLHGYANPLKRLGTSESVNLYKCLILLDSCRIHATRRHLVPILRWVRKKVIVPPSIVIDDVNGFAGFTEFFLVITRHLDLRDCNAAVVRTIGGAVQY